MRYSPARTEADYADANALIAESGYYDPIRLQDLGGMVMLAKDGNSVIGCVWVAITGKLAILDYLVADKAHPGVGMRLLTKLRSSLRLSGVKQVRYFIHGKNITTYRIAAALGGKHDFPYVLGCVNLEADNGN